MTIIKCKRFQKEEKMTFEGMFDVPQQHKAFTKYGCLKTNNKKKKEKKKKAPHNVLPITIAPQQFWSKGKIQMLPDR